MLQEDHIQIYVQFNKMSLRNMNILASLSQNKH
jgi:hypothetical protein